MSEKNHYDTLGVDNTATEAEIKQAFRKLVRKYHPDVNDSPDADDRVAALNIAYETLSDPEERAKYDASQSPFGTFPHGFKRNFKEGFADFSQFTSTSDSKDSKTKEAFDKATSETYWQDLNTNVQKNWEEIKETLSENAPFSNGRFNFDDLVSPFKKSAEDNTESNTQRDANQSMDSFKDFDKFADLFGSSGTDNTSSRSRSRESNQSDQSDTCFQSMNTDSSSESANLEKGEDQQTEIPVDLASTYTGDNYNIKLNVPVCQPDGNISHDEKTVIINIPKGITEGEKIRLPEKGAASSVGGKNGDLFLKVIIKHDQRIRVDGADVYQTVNIAPWEAVLGADISVNTPAGEFEVSIPPNSTSSNTLRLSNKGIPAKKCGNLYLVLNITHPKVQHPSQRLAYEKLRDAFKGVEIER